MPPNEHNCIICTQLLYDPLLRETIEDGDERIKKLAEGILKETIKLLKENGYMEGKDAWDLAKYDDLFDEITAMIIMKLMPEETEYN